MWLHRIWAWAVAGAMLAGVGAAACAAQADSLKSGSFKPPRPAPEFSLQGSDGSLLQLRRFKGKVVAVGFGYTFCPDVCPTTLADLALARKQLGPAGADLQVVYITVDPERDTARRLGEYLSFFDPSFVGGTGSQKQIAEVLKAYGVQSVRKSPPGTSAAYLVHHSSSVYLIDRSGMLRAMVPFGVPVEDVIHDLRLLLRR
jgi:protein SCO1/2